MLTHGLRPSTSWRRPTEYATAIRFEYCFPASAVGNNPLATVRFDRQGPGDVLGHDLGDTVERIGVARLVEVIELPSAPHVQIQKIMVVPDGGMHTGAPVR